MIDVFRLNDPNADTSCSDKVWWITWYQGQYVYCPLALDAAYVNRQNDKILMNPFKLNMSEKRLQQTVAKFRVPSFSVIYVTSCWNVFNLHVQQWGWGGGQVYGWRELDRVVMISDHIIRNPPGTNRPRFTLIDLFPVTITARLVHSSLKSLIYIW